MNTMVVALPGKDSVSTDLTYLKPGITGEVFFRMAPKPDQQRTNLDFRAFSATIADIRGIESQASLDVHGFQFAKHKSTNDTLERCRRVDKEFIKTEYYNEMSEFLKEVTGADRVLVFDHAVRRSTPNIAPTAGGSQTTVSSPANSVHIDQSPLGARWRIEQFFPDEVEKLLNCRSQIINLWRPLSEPVESWPLALADFRSVSIDDLLPSRVHFPSILIETYAVHHNPEHQWYYLSKQLIDEITLIKCFDSKKGVANVCPHTAFYHPTQPEGTIRESIELRALVFYLDQQND